jgi:hypothetical protein
MGQAKQRGTFEQRSAAAKLRDAAEKQKELEYAEHVKALGAELGIEIMPIRPKGGASAGTLAIVSVPQLETLAEAMRPYLADALAAKAAAAPPACPCGPECECGANAPAEPPAEAAPVPAVEAVAP